MISVLFTDGTLVIGKTYRAAEDALRASQWSTYSTRREFRREMRARARVWSGRTLKARNTLTSKSFLNALASVGMCRIDGEPESRQA